MKKIISNINFMQARIIIYTILIIAYIYFAYFNKFKCLGCPLCGMTRAVKSLLILDFAKAFEYNKNVWVFCIILPIIIIDILFIIYEILRTVGDNNKEQSIRCNNIIFNKK